MCLYISVCVRIYIYIYIHIHTHGHRRHPTDAASQDASLGCRGKTTQVMHTSSSCTILHGIAQMHMHMWPRRPHVPAALASLRHQQHGLADNMLHKHLAAAQASTGGHLADVHAAPAPRRRQMSYGIPQMPLVKIWPHRVWPLDTARATI